MTAGKARLTVCVGGGGVGKTTTSAALALQLARAGKRTLVITVDPARRLADALGLEVGQETRQARQGEVGESAGGRLWAKMPDPRASMDDFMVWLFEEPEQRARVMANPAYRELADSLAGIHELLTLGLLQNELDSGRFDEVVLDTAPSRNALAFLTYPSRFLELLEAKALTWLSSLAATNAKRDSVPPPARSGGIFAWGRAKVEGVFGRVVGLEPLRNLSALFSEMATVRARWAGAVGRSANVLEDPSTRYLVVGAPSGGSLADVAFLTDALAKRSLRPTALVLNRAETGESAAERGVGRLLEGRTDLVVPADAALLRTTLAALAKEHRARAAAAEEAVRFLEAKAQRGTPVLRLPFVGPAPAGEIVVALADAWKDALATLPEPFF